MIVKYGKVTIPCKYKAKDLWLQDEEKAILAYLAEPEIQDAHAVDQMSKGIITVSYTHLLSEMYKNKIIFIAEKSPKVAFFAFIM